MAFSNFYEGLVFLVSGAVYEASYKTSFASVLFDFALREMNANEVSYEAPMLTRKTRLNPKRCGLFGQLRMRGWSKSAQ